MPLHLNLRIEGLAELQRKLSMNVLLGPPLRAAVDETVKEAATIVSSHAPRRSGRMAASVTHRLDARPVPTWGRVAVTAVRKSKKSPSGYRYPKWLEFAPKSPRRGWFKAAVLPAKAVLERHLTTAARRIEAIWRA